ncbi:uncharacterized protein LOC130905533 isoform X1 [Corythoichthys intestinalis]|uniref:uncharacterized protein LOC130905533 isoform X1 n=1 Tax=Corythoichthys intestinalis TaxID=161448 RepID=UPI0025A63547|nr:uncharacterized protein LOC130905533 isoform X1 [Corythoichthys intestinalis]
MNEQTPSPVYHLTVALFGKRMLSNNHIGKLILANDDVFRKISKDFGVGENHSFKVINVPNFFEDCPAPDQQVIDLLALAYPGPDLFLLAIDSENKGCEDVVEQMRKLEKFFGNSIKHNLIVIFEKQELYDSILYLKDNNIQLGMLNENLATDCKIWGAARPSFLYDYKDHSWRVIERRMEQLKMTRSSEVETKTRPGPTKLAGRGNRIGQTPQLIASSDATDIDNASRGGSITPKEHFPHPRRAAYPRSGVNNARK